MSRSPGFVSCIVRLTNISRIISNFSHESIKLVTMVKIPIYLHKVGYFNIYEDNNMMNSFDQ